MAIQQNLSSEDIGWGPGYFQALVHRGRDAIEGVHTVNERKSIPEAPEPVKPDVVKVRGSEDV